jgi:Cu+-exporting ATPase
MKLARAIGFGTLAFFALLAAYFAVLTLVSGWAFALSQFREFWYFVLPLAAGFGIQIGLFAYLKRLVSTSHGTGAVAAASGTTSTAAMISCCAHYLVNVAPVIGATGLVTFAAQYQVEFFWVGLAFNAAGVAYIGNRVLNAVKEHARCATV